MSTIFRPLLIAVLLSVPAAIPGGAATISTVDNDKALCILYETDADGKATERPPGLTLPFNPKPGYLILLKKGTTGMNEDDWSDVILFKDNTVQLFSGPFIFKGTQGADVPFSSFEVKHGMFDGNALGQLIQISETTPSTEYKPKREQPGQQIVGEPGDPQDGRQFTYRIFSPVPESSGLLTSLIGFASLLIFKRRFERP